MAKKKNLIRNVVFEYVSEPIKIQASGFPWTVATMLMMSPVLSLSSISLYFRPGWQVYYCIKKWRDTEWSSPVWDEIIDESLTAHNVPQMFCCLPGWHGQDGNYSIFEIIAYREMTHLDLQNLDGDLVMDIDKYLSVYGFPELWADQMEAPVFCFLF